MKKSVTPATLSMQVAQGVSVLDLWAPWCGPCKILTPLLEELAPEIGFKLLTLNVDDDKSVAESFGVQSIPTMIVYRDGKPLEKITGAYPKEKLRQHFNHLLAREGDHDGGK